MSTQRLVVNTDGGSRGNPGEAAIGVVVFNEVDQVLEEFAATIGHATNNQAEYAALLAGLDRARKHTHGRVRFRLDSELVVKQLNGEYKIKSDQIRKLHHQAKALEHHFADVEYLHVPRAENTHADALVNAALDAPDTFPKETL